MNEGQVTLSPEGKCPDIREAVIGLIADYEKRMEEAERRIELLSNALKSTLTSRPNPRTAEGRKLPEPVTGERDWRPIGDGEKYWANPQGFSTPADQVPEEFRARFREPGTPRAEYPPEEA